MTKIYNRWKVLDNKLSRIENRAELDPSGSTQKKNDIHKTNVLLNQCIALKHRWLRA